jgi:hypothetical protein
MSCNIYQPHLHIYAEDAATHDVADGFMQSFSGCKQRQIQVFPCGSGYASIKEKMRLDAKLSSFPCRRIACVIDFDNHPERLDELKKCVDPQMRKHVYVVGCADEIESSKEALKFQGSNDTFGKRLSNLDGRDWEQPCLNPSKAELNRLLADLRLDGICPS